MEGKDDNKYNNVREIYSDVRLIFANAMKYNDERHDVHIMAKSLLEKFEEKWLQLLPKVENEVNVCKHILVLFGAADMGYLAFDSNNLELFFLGKETKG